MLGRKWEGGTSYLGCQGSSVSWVGGEEEMRVVWTTDTRHSQLSHFLSFYLPNLANTHTHTHTHTHTRTHTHKQAESLNGVMEELHAHSKALKTNQEITFSDPIKKYAPNLADCSSWELLPRNVMFHHVDLYCSISGSMGCTSM